MNSSDWWAKEKEWRDSLGNRSKSSMKAGDDGPEARGCNMVIEVDRERLRDGLREVGLEGPSVPFLPGWD